MFSTIVAVPRVADELLRLTRYTGGFSSVMLVGSLVPVVEDRTGDISFGNPGGASLGAVPFGLLAAGVSVFWAVGSLAS